MNQFIFAQAGFLPIALVLSALGFLNAQFARQTVRYIYALYVALFFGSMAYDHSFNSFPLADIVSHQQFSFWWAMGIYFVSVSGLWVGDKIQLSR